MNEKQLMHDAASDFEAFAELYHRNITRVYRYHMVHAANKNAAEELTAQTFMAALKDFPAFRNRDSFAVCVLEIAVEKCRRDHRASRRELADDATLYYQVASLPSDKANMQRIEIESASRALKQISSDRAEAIALHCFGDLTHSEISVVLKKSVAAIEVLITRGLEDLHSRVSPSTNTESKISDFEAETLRNKLSSLAAQMAPDPLFEAELEQVLASHYRPKTKWTLRFAQVSSMIGWIALIGLTLFLLSWRDAANQPTTNQATARPPSQQVRETVVTKITSTPRRPTASPTATGIPLQEYTVQAGDTCTSIANKFGLTIDLLTTLNRLNNTCDIWADQKLKVPIAPITTPSS